MYREALARGLKPQQILEMIYCKGRDNARTPMQWDSSPSAGFTSGTPWIQVNPNYMEINVQQALADPGSIYHYYRKLIQLRKSNPVIVYGRYDWIQEVPDPIYAFTRTLDSDRLLVILNFSKDHQVLNLPAGIADTRGDLLISNYAVDSAQALRSLSLRPYEARVYRLT
jgi:oligo-1,6-glucosidase